MINTVNDNPETLALSDEVIQCLRNSNRLLGDNPYAYAFGAIWALLNDDQRRYVFSFVKEITKNEDTVSSDRSE
jgi:hypothetical protein